jgi:PAS domain S-box-containing protein
MEQTISRTACLVGGGEMGQLIRSKDWSNTSLGDPEDWSLTLQTTVNILLNSMSPMFLFWGDDLLCFYNDAYRPSLGNGGKHPGAVGEKAEVVWPEIWADIKPWIDGVMEKGQAIWREDQFLPIYRNGKLEDVYWTFSYSPVIDERCKPAGVLVTCMETTGKVLALQRIEQSENNLRNVILQAPAAMAILKGPSFVVEIANEKMFELWGRGKEELVGKSIFEGLPEVRNQGYEEMLTSVYETGKRVSILGSPVTLPRHGGIKTVYINLLYEAFREGDGTVSGIMAVATDVTEQVLARKKIEEVVNTRTEELAHANQRLLRTNEELQRSNSSLEEFAHAASHDLKEPIRKVHFFADSLKHKLEGRLNEEEARLFNRMESATERMGLLVDDLLNYSHVSTTPVEKDPVDLNDKLRKVLDDLELLVTQKKAVITADTLPTVNGYRRQLQQLFRTLLATHSNTTSPGVPPVVSISCREVFGREFNSVGLQDKDKRFYRIDVEDNGVGFAQKDADKIFQMFHRLHGNHEYKGTGVGLAIARKVVLNHDGYITAESELGKGATFTVLLPA